MTRLAMFWLVKKQRQKIYLANGGTIAIGNFDVPLKEPLISIGRVVYILEGYGNGGCA